MAATIGIAAGEASFRWALRTPDGAVKYGVTEPAADAAVLLSQIERQHRVSLKGSSSVRVADTHAAHVIRTLEAAGYQPVLASLASAAWAGIKDSVAIPAEGHLLVCDIGASATQYSLVDAHDGTVIQQITDDRCSGDAIDANIARYLHERHPNPAPFPQADLVVAARQLKESLAAGGTAAVHVNGERIALNADELERVAAPLLAASFARVSGMLASTSIAVTGVALIGGGAQLPFLVGVAGDWFRVIVYRPVEAAYAVVLGLVADASSPQRAAARFPAWTLVTAGAVSIIVAVGLGLYLASGGNSQWDSIVRDRQGAVTVPQRSPYPVETDTTRVPRTEWMAPPTTQPQVPVQPLSPTTTQQPTPLSPAPDTATQVTTETSEPSPTTSEVTPSEIVPTTRTPNPVTPPTTAESVPPRTERPGTGQQPPGTEDASQPTGAPEAEEDDISDPEDEGEA